MGRSRWLRRAAAVAAASIAAGTAAGGVWARVAQVSPTVTAAPTVSGVPSVGQTLTASSGLWAGDVPLSFAYQWLDCEPQGGCNPIAGATDQTYVVQLSDIGSGLAVSVTATNDAGSSTALSSPSGVVTGGIPPSALTNPTITGTTREGSTLTATPGTWAGDMLLDVLYQWQRCSPSTLTCIDLPGATGSAYPLGPTDTGFELQVSVTVSNDAGTAEATSGMSALVTGPPVDLTAPAVTGSAIVGEVLTAEPGDWQVTSAVGYAYQWQRCSAGDACVNIVGATSASYHVGPYDASLQLRVLVTANTASGSTQLASNLTGVVIAAPTIVGSARAGSTLEAQAGSSSGQDQLDYAYVWQRCDAEGMACASLPGAMAQSFVLAAGDIGERLRVVVTVTSSLGVASADSAPTSLVTAHDPYQTIPLGVDVSYPDCERSRPRLGGFVIVGLNDGLPFTSNPCFEREFAWAEAEDAPTAVYLNTGYSRRLLGAITPACRRRAAGDASMGLASQNAYALGCSEASFSLATTHAAAVASVIWLDVERANVWSSDQALNAMLIQGMVAALESLDPGATVGIYSDRHWWLEITAGLSSPLAPEWTPALGADACELSFADGPVWLTQGGGTGLDVDRAC